MTKNDKSLLSQMIHAGRFNYDIYVLLCKQNELASKALIKKMGNKWVCHPDNFVKKLTVPLDVLNSYRGSKILKHLKHS